MKSRSQAIRTAVNKYNAAAAKLVPAAPTIDFAQLLEWTELQEFELLRHSRTGDVREKDWANPTNRVMAVKFHKLARAREELVHCEVEMRRLVTAMRDEEEHMLRVLSGLRESNNPLAPELEETFRRRASVNEVHRARFAKLVLRFPAFAAANVPGVRAGSADTSSAAGGTVPAQNRPSPSTSIVPMTDSDVQDDLDTPDDSVVQDLGAVEDFIVDTD